MIAFPDQAVELHLEVPHGQIIRYDLANLCSALGINDPTRIVVETDGLRNAIVTVYPSNPLSEVRAVTLDDLVMDRRGYIIVGRYHNGRPVKLRMFDPSTGSAQRFLLFGTTGAGKSRTVQMMLIAEKVNSIVSWLADLKDGQSVPEAAGQVDWRVVRQEAAILMLRAGVAVAKDRNRRYSAAGRSAFLLAAGDPLLHITIDEANRLLEKGAPYRDEATYLIRELGRTGRSVGVGIRLAAQASHLEELGGSDTLRAMLKEGEVTLLRWSSSMMRQLVSDGLLPAGEQLMPIPKTLKPRVLVSQFDEVDEDEDDAPGTQGTAYLLSGPHPTAMMRHFRVGSVAPLPGLDPEILALYGTGAPAHLEEASWDAAGQAYAMRHDEHALGVLCQQLAEELTAPAVTPVGAAASADHRPAPARLEDRILAALAAADEPMTGDDILAAVNADGRGREIRIGSVRNALGPLVDAGAIARVGHGLYAPQ